jgi:signal transduction histidine kinase
MKLQTRVGLGFVASLTAFAAVLIVLFLAFNFARVESSRIHDNFIPSIDAARRLMVNVERMENAEFLYFVPGQDTAVWTKRFDEASAKFQEAFLVAESLAGSLEERAIMVDLGRNFGALLHIDTRMRELLRNGRVAEARRLNETESLEVALRMRENAQAFYTYNLEESRRAGDAQRQGMRLTEWAAMAIVLLGALGAGLLWRGASRDLVEPVRAIKAATDAIALGRYKAAHHPAARKTLELETLQDAFNHMSAQLRDVTDRLRAANASLETQVGERTQALTQANRQLEQVVEELRALDQIKSNFMAVMSHELLTPINFITGFASTLEDELLGPLNPKQQDAMAKITEGADRLTRMVRNTLDFTQLSSDKLTVLPEPIEYACLLDGVAARFQAPIAAKGLRFELALPDELPPVWADPNRVEQLLVELLDNALKFTATGGRIRVSARSTPEAVVTEVADTGIGIAPGAVGHLHKGFYQADFSSTRPHGGMGLGLAIAYGLLAKMGGTLVVQSRIGQGTTFQFTLPRADAPAPVPTALGLDADHRA